MSLIDCRVMGCTGKTFDGIGVCPACRTKIQHGEIVLVQSEDRAEKTEMVKGIALLVAVAIVAITVIGRGDLAGLVQ